MRRIRRKAAGLAFLLTGSLGAGMLLTGCGSATARLEPEKPQYAEQEDLNHNTETEKSQASEEQQKAFRQAAADFSIELLQQSAKEKESSMVSPTSVLMAMTMVENGAVDNTLVQMIDTLGGGQSLAEQNENLSSWYHALPSGENAKLKIANSIWFLDYGDAFQVSDEFLSENQKYYDTEVYKSAFDNQTLEDINKWVDTNTDGMIDRVLDEISPQAVMYLINAVAFDARWQDVYEAEQVGQADFTAADGTVSPTDMMYSQESRYLEDENATGFIKPYEDGYSFVALLPNEGVSVEDYLAAMTGEQFLATIQNAQDCKVEAAIPKFKSEYELVMNDALQNMGITDAFDPVQADFGGMESKTDNELYISKVLHKTYIAVDELGTKAGAVTAVIMESTGAMLEEPKRVYLDRPFVYAIIDDESSLPIFIGTTQKIE